MVKLQRIDTPNDPRIAAYTAIRERDLARAHGGRFIVEGKVALTAMLRSRFRIESIFVCETKVGFAEQIGHYIAADVPVYVAPQPLMDAVAGFPMHRGVLACGLRDPRPLAPAEVLAGPVSTALILVGLSNHDNVGACFRNAAAFGARAVLLDQTCCDPLYRKAIRVSSGSALTMPFVHGGTGADLVAAAKREDFAVWALTPRADAAPLQSLAVPPRLALMLGAEAPGLPAALLGCALPVRIPMEAGIDSINVATAAAIALAAIYAARLIER